MSLNYRRTIATPGGYSRKPSNRQVLLDKLYVGKIKDNRDVRSMGRLKVWIPELSQDENEKDGWFLVSYCSPFAGATSVISTENSQTGNENTFEATQKSYGWWAVPPDLNVQVLCMFANGDSSRGFWVGCVFDEQMNWMVPGIASDDNKAPKAEYNRKTKGLGKAENPLRSTHTPMETALIGQGLETDTLRGLSSSSAKRRGDFGTSTVPNNLSTHYHKPAKNYGFLSPGGHQFVIDDGWDNGTQGSLIRFRTKNGAQILIDDCEGLIYFISKGGRAWAEISDKGNGNIDLYSTTNVSIHAEKGSINLKAGYDINIQAGRDINIRSERDSKLYSKRDIDIKAEEDITIESQVFDLTGTDYTISVNDVNFSTIGDMTISVAGAFSRTVTGDINKVATLNEFNNVGGDQHNIVGTGTAFGGFQRTTAIPSSPPTLRPESGTIEFNETPATPAITLPADIASSAIVPAGSEVVGPSVLNTTWSSGNNYSSLENIVSRVPQHEPWSPHIVQTRVRTFATPTPEQQTNQRALPEDSAGRTGDSETINPPNGQNAPTPFDPPNTTPLGGTICDLNEVETQKFLDVIGNRESAGDYGVTNTFGYLGKYQMGTGALEDAGYIKKGTFKKYQDTGRDPQTALDDENNWTIKGGKTAYLAGADTQEDAMKKYSNANCSRLKSGGAITSSTPTESKAGLIAASHIGGVGGAIALAAGQNRTDAYGGSTLEYFNLGAGSIKLV